MCKPPMVHFSFYQEYDRIEINLTPKFQSFLQPAILHKYNVNKYGLLLLAKDYTKDTIGVYNTFNKN